MDKNKNTLFPTKKGWLITSAVFVSCILLFMFAGRNILASADTKQTMWIISDSFWAFGILFACAGALTWISSKGLFDSFSYLFRNFSLPLLLPGTSPKKYTKLIDYKIEKDEKGRKWFPHLLIIGGIGVLISLIFTAIYSVL